MEGYTWCELSGGGTPKLLSFLIFVVAVHSIHQYMLCIVAIVDCTMYTMLSTTQKKTEHTISVTIVDCTHVGSTTASFKGLHRRTLTKMFRQRSATDSLGL